MASKRVDALLAWYQKEKRTLPWRERRDAYGIWVSEIMLQQTQVDTVIPYYLQFMERFPTIFDLAKAEEEAVLKLWQGLGYYSRARNLHKGARQVVENHEGQVPKNYPSILKISGIGDYTAGAILSIAYNLPEPAVDGNVLRVYARWEGMGEDIKNPAVRQKVRAAVKAMIPPLQSSHFNQALMDLGATVCTPKNPKCEACPVKKWCTAFAQETQSVLPLKTANKKPLEEKRLILLLVYQNKIYIQKRTEGLLQGLWEFPGIILQEDAEKSVKAYLKEKNLTLKHMTLLPNRSHVFTHRIWKMQGVWCEVDGTLEGEWAERDSLSLYPWPTALKGYLEDALKRLPSSKSGT